MDGRGPGEPGEAAVERLLHHTEWLRRLASSLVVDAALADDVAQQTLLLALQRPPASDRHPKAWLATVARNVARTFARGEQRRESRERLAASDVRLPATDDLVAQATLHHAVVGAVLAIEEPYRTLLLRRWFEERKPGALARELGVPVETVRTRLKRGLELVRAELVRRRALPGGVVALVALLDGTARAAALKAVAAGVGAAATVGGAATLGANGAWGAFAMSTQGKVVLAVSIVLLTTVGAFKLVDRETSPREEQRSTSSTASLPIEAGDATSPTYAPQRALEGAATASGEGTPIVIRGVVLDEAGAPIAGAAVGVLPPGRAGELTRDPPPPPFEFTDASTTANTEGVFELIASAAQVVPTSTLDVAATARGFVPTVWRRARALDEIVLVMKRGVELSGMVRDLAGQPVAGATLRWRHDGEWRVSGTTISAADGSYCFDDAVAMGAVFGDDSVPPPWVDVVADGFAPMTFFAWDNGKLLDPRHWELDVWLVRGATVRGTVVDSETGTPLAGAEVWLRMFDPRAGLAPLRTTSGSDGGFVLEHLPAWGVTLVGQHGPSYGRRRLGSVCAIAPDRGLASEPLDVLDDGAERVVRLALPRVGGVRGRVVDARGQPVAGANVACGEAAESGRHDRSELDGLPWRAILTDSDGRYTIEGLALAKGAASSAPLAALFESAPNIYSESKTVEVPLVADRVVEVPDLVVRTPPAALCIEVVDDGGIPVSRAQVSVAVPVGERVARSELHRTDPDGRCGIELAEITGRMAAARAELGLLVVSADGFASLAHSIALADGNHRVELARERRLLGSVRDIDGRPGLATIVAVAADLPAADLVAAMRSSEFWRSEGELLAARAESVAGSGRFVLRGLGPGPWHVAAVRRNTPDGETCDVAVAESVAGDAPVELVLAGSAQPLIEPAWNSKPSGPTGDVEVTLTFAATGKPVLRFGDVALRSGDRRHQGRATAPGRVLIREVPVGRYDLVVDAPGAARQKRPVEVVAGSMTRVAAAIESGLVARGRIALDDLPPFEVASLFFQSDDGGGSATGTLGSDGAYDIPGLVAGKSYRQWMHLKESADRSSLWVAEGDAQDAMSVSTARPVRWLPAAVLDVNFLRRELLGEAASLRVSNESGELVWSTTSASQWGLERVLPNGTYTVELQVPGRSLESRTVTLCQGEPTPELFMLQK